MDWEELMRAIRESQGDQEGAPDTIMEPREMEVSRVRMGPAEMVPGGAVAGGRLGGDEGMQLDVPRPGYFLSGEDKAAGRSVDLTPREVEDLGIPPMPRMDRAAQQVQAAKQAQARRAALLAVRRQAALMGRQLDERQ